MKKKFLISRVIMFIVLYVLIHLGTNQFLYGEEGGIWLFPTSLLGLIFGFGDSRFIYLGDLFTTICVFLLLDRVISKLSC